jgi:hypothetical protein
MRAPIRSQAWRLGGDLNPALKPRMRPLGVGVFGGQFPEAGRIRVQLVGPVARREHSLCVDEGEIVGRVVGERGQHGFEIGDGLDQVFNSSPLALRQKRTWIRSDTKGVFSTFTRSVPVKEKPVSLVK